MSIETDPTSFLAPHERASLERAAARKALRDAEAAKKSKKKTTTAPAKAPAKKAAKKADPVRVQKPSKQAKKPASAPEQEPAKEPAKTRAPKVDHAAAVRDIPEATVKLTSNVAPSVEIATELQTAFDHFNHALFEGKLEPVVFSNVRLKKSHGHFWAKGWERRVNMEGKAHEIGLDFARLKKDGQGDAEVLSTLVHEMCHQLIEQIGKAPAKAYHCKYWVAAMLMVGLEPIILDAKGVPTGKATGPNSSHRIVEGGKFHIACQELMHNRNFKLSWYSEFPEAPEKPKAKKKAGAKAKHTCPTCSANAWGKPSLHLHCNDGHKLIAMECPDREEYDGGDGEEGSDD